MGLQTEIAEIIEELSYDKYGCAKQILAKMREVVEGAKLTDYELARANGNCMLILNPESLATCETCSGICNQIAKAQRQAILKAMED